MSEPATLAILAGGRGERMGKAKGELKLGDRAILTYLLDRFQWPGPTMLVTSPGRESPPGAEGFDVEVVDPVEGMGPVRGVLTALENFTTPFLVVTSVDMPLLESMHLHWLLKNIPATSLGLMIKRQDLIEPFPSAFRKEAKEAIVAHLAAGNRSLHSLTKHPGFPVLAAPSGWRDDVWTNLNEPADVDAFARRIKHR